VLYVGTRANGLFKSTDWGYGWSQVTSLPVSTTPNGNGISFVMDDPSSVSGGVSWINGRSIHWAGVVAFDPFNPKLVWVTSGNGIFKTSDIDAVPTTWTFTIKGLEETVPLHVYSMTNGPLLSAVGDIDGFQHYNIYTYTNPAYSPFMGTSSSGLTVADGNQQTVVRVGPKMYVSQDGGVNWTQVGMNGSYGQVALSANGAALLHGPDQSTTTYRSTNLGGSWSAVSGLNVRSARPIADPVNSSKFYVYDPSTGKFMISADGGASFWQFNTLATGGSNVIRAAPGREGDICVPLYGGGLARTTSSGWQFTTFSNVTYCGAVGFGKAATGATYPTVYIWGTVNGVRGLYRSTDTGATWTRINYHPVNSSLLYARTDVGGLYRWNATNSSWIPLPDGVGFGAGEERFHGVESVALDPTNDQKVYMTTSDSTYWSDPQNGNPYYGRLYISSDRGITWSHVDLPFPVGGNDTGRAVGERLKVDPTNPSTMFYGSRTAGM
jgi:hypothetical protein